MAESAIYFISRLFCSESVCVFSSLNTFPFRKIGTFAIFELPALRLLWRTYLLK